MEISQLEGMPQESKESVKRKVLFIDDDRNILDAMREVFDGEKGVEFAECHSISDAIKAIEVSCPDVIFLDNSFSADEKNAGLKVADIVKDKWQDTDIYSTTGDDGVDREYSSRGIKHVDKHDISGIMSIVSDEGKALSVKP